MLQRFYGAIVGLFAMLSYFNILNNSFAFDDFGLLNEAVRRGDWWFLASVWMLVAFSLVANVVAPIGTMMGEALMKRDGCIGGYPDYVAAHYNTGVFYGTLQQYAKAIEAYALAVKLRSGHARAWLNLGAAYRELLRLPPEHARRVEYEDWIEGR